MTPMSLLRELSANRVTIVRRLRDYDLKSRVEKMIAPTTKNVASSPRR